MTAARSAQSKNVEVVLPEPFTFMAGGPFDDDERRKQTCWCTNCGDLVRFLRPFLPSQKPAWRTHILSKQEHTGHILETVPVGQWPNLNAPGNLGRLARMSYTATRKMSPETFLGILAKFPRGKRHSERTFTEVARQITDDLRLRYTIIELCRRFENGN